MSYFCRHYLCSAVFVIAAVFAARPGQAQRLLSMSGDLGMGGIGGLAHTTIQSGVQVHEGGLSLALFGRVRLPMSGDERVRGRDWDEPTDYVHILRQLRYRRQFEALALDVRVGELHGTTLGHGTVVRDFSNVADPDHPHPGVRLELVHERFELSLMVDNFVRPALAGGRFALRPLPRLKGFAAGATLVVDPRAPRAVLVDREGQRRIDGAASPVTDDTVLAITGLDVEHRVGGAGRDDRSLTPYLDLNSAFYGGDQRNAGLGLHAGLRGALPLRWRGVRLAAQAEYHLSSAGYAPSWVQTFHDLDRYQASLAFDDPQQATPQSRGTKLAAVARGSGGHGFLAQLGLEVGQRATVKAGFSREAGPDANRAWLRLSARPVQRLTLGALLMMRGLGQSQAAAGVAAVAEARCRLSDHLYALAQYGRIWSLDDQTRYFGILQSFNLGVGSSWSG